MSAPKILTVDIETAPAHALVFGQRLVNIANIQVIQPDRIIGIGAKWHGNPAVLWRSEYHHSKDEMLSWIHGLLDEADVVVHFNGTTFDMPWINRECALAGMKPYSPVQEIDLLRIARKRFRFMNNKLENLVAMFNVSLKMQNGGFKLWRDIEVGTDEEKRKAWNIMRLYCKQDVRIEEQLYDRLIDWLPSLPPFALYGHDGSPIACPQCGSSNLKPDGFYYAKQSKYRKFQCTDCGRYGRETRRVAGLQIVGVS